MSRAMGSHQSAKAQSVVWLTPPGIIQALGGAGTFDLDPCAAPAPRPWPTARHMNGQADANGLLIDWWGRVWLNPPYSSAEIGKWMRRLADHGRGTALIFANEPRVFTASLHCEQNWPRDKPPSDLDVGLDRGIR